jgi:hypothetical protein
VLDRQPYTIVGVMGKNFVFPIETQLDISELWVPMAFTQEERKAVGDNFGYNTVARLKPGVSLAQAQADVERVAQIIRDGYPAAVKSQFEVHGVIMGLREAALGNYRRPMLIMLLAVVFILLIAIVNVANLLLTKGTSRQREFSIRFALGATGRSIITRSHGRSSRADNREPGDQSSHPRRSSEHTAASFAGNGLARIHLRLRPFCRVRNGLRRRPCNVRAAGQRE